MLFSKLKIGNYTLRNRIVLPPMVRHKVIDTSGYVNDELIQYYSDMSQADNGMVIVEATCVSSDGKLRDNQLGIWNDTFIVGLNKIAIACQQWNVPVILQIHHIGFRENIATIEEAKLDEILDDFVSAAFRAKLSGFNGIELHAAHRYLLCQLHSKLWNSRTDKYGGTFENRTYFIREFFRRTKALFDDDFIIGIRMGGNEPAIEDGIKLAKEFERLGAQFLHISHGIADPSIRQFDKVEKPECFPLNWINYMSKPIKEKVNIPVIAVYEIKNPKQACYILENNIADLVAVGRSQLNNTTWIPKAKRYCEENNKKNN